MSIEDEEFYNNIMVCFGKHGQARLIGTFEPVLGDIGRDVEGKHWVWEGKHWINSTGKRAKTFAEWMGFHASSIKKAAEANADRRASSGRSLLEE